MNRPPRVTIAVPVYNGEEFLAEALGSILAQSYTDFEVIVGDNASTDRTAEIARGFAERDSRVRVITQSTNIGAAPNFNDLFRYARGEFFKWAASDDLLEPTLVERCVQALDDSPGAVLAYPLTRVIGPRGETLEIYQSNPETASPDLATRFQASLVGHKCFEIFGLIRKQALDRTELIGLYSHGDGVLLGHLSLMGPFVAVPEPLFLARRHPRQSMAMLGDYRRYAVWFNPKLKGKLIFPHWKIYSEYLKVALTEPPSFARLPLAGRVLRAAVGKHRHLRADIGYQVRRFAKRFGITFRTNRMPYAQVESLLVDSFGGHSIEVRELPQDSDGLPRCELAFLTPEVGARNQVKLESLSYRTNWLIQLATKPRLAALAQTVDQVGTRYGFESGHFEVDAEERVIRFEPPHDDSGFSALAAEIRELTGYELEISRSEPV